MGVAQYIKGQWDNGEYTFSSRWGLSFILWEPVLPGRTEPASGYRRGERGLVGKQTELADKRYDLVVLDELTYMLASIIWTPKK